MWIIIFSQIFNLSLLIYTLKLFKMPFLKSLRSFGHFQAEWLPRKLPFDSIFNLIMRSAEIYS